MSHQSLVLTRFNEFEVKERALAELTGTNAIIKILATAICGSDIHGANGSTGRRFPDQVMGHETCGIVEKVSDGTSSDLVGKRVVINPVIACHECALCLGGKEYLCPSRKVLGVTKGVDGAFAQYVIVPIRNLAFVSDEISPTLATAVEPLSVGYHAVIRAEVTQKDRVLIIGGGPIGQAIGFACARTGVNDFLISEPSESKREYISKFGFTSISPADLEDHYRSKDKPTVVFDAVGNAHSFRDAFTHSNVAARIVLVGMDAPDLSIPSYEVSADERSVLGSYCYTNNEFSETATWLGINSQLVAPFISDVVPMQDAPAIFEKLLQGSFEYNRIVISQDA
ncbi:MAG: alcohol dehydrogenase catalytic domain-containing protein [Actinobacteria bacterium]|nr:alcohol dehydrogenase catalytic domain-containing protein [Actinomycetota bacterium]